MPEAIKLICSGVIFHLVFSHAHRNTQKHIYIYNVLVIDQQSNSVAVVVKLVNRGSSQPCFYLSLMLLLERWQMYYWLHELVKPCKVL